MTDTTPWRPASGPPAGAGHARVPGAPAPGFAGHPHAPGPGGPTAPGGSGASGPADPGFVASGIPGAEPEARRAVFGSAGYPGGASGRHSVRVAARTANGSADPEARSGGPAAAPGGRNRLRQARRANGSGVGSEGRPGGPATGPAGALLGLVRDQTIAHLFGAGHDSDAFLIAWTVPEMASTLLIEDAMALLMVPAFSQALARRAAARAGLTRSEARAQDPVRLLVGATLPRLAVFLAAVASLLVVAAPAVVSVLAPGLPDPALAVECTRFTALTVLSFGIAGYFSAALRAHRSFLPPAAIYVSYNVGIIGTMVALHALWGVRAAAAGVAVGGLFMALVQLPAFVRNVGFGQPRAKKTAPRSQRDRDRPTLIAFGVIAPVIFFAVFRQSQVLVERFLAASLPPGAISHLNYAQKVAQMPMVLSLMICTVTFPVVAQAMAAGEREKARRRVEQDLTLAALAVLAGTALVIGYAPQIIQVLFERGAFTHQDTLATASVMRVYACGLLGHCLVGALSRPFFSTARPTWFPALAMGAGLLVNIVAGAFAVGWWGTYGIAAANAAGISTTAALLLTGLGSRIIAVQVRRVAVSIGKLAVAAVAAGAAGWIAGPMIPDPMLSAALGCLLVPAMFGATGTAIRALEVTALPGQISQLTQRFRNVR